MLPSLCQVPLVIYPIHGMGAIPLVDVKTILLSHIYGGISLIYFPFYCSQSVFGSHSTTNSYTNNVSNKKTFNNNLDGFLHNSLGEIYGSRMPTNQKKLGKLEL